MKMDNDTMSKFLHLNFEESKKAAAGITDFLNKVRKTNFFAIFLLFRSTYVLVRKGGIKIM